jgi:hypothetical protein
MVIGNPEFYLRKLWSGATVGRMFKKWLNTKSSRQIQNGRETFQKSYAGYREAPIMMEVACCK